jgi:hypothetical protein
VVLRAPTLVLFVGTSTVGLALARHWSRGRGLHALVDNTAVVHAKTLDAFNRLTELRRQRLEAVGWAVPDTRWSVALLGAALAIVAS